MKRFKGHIKSACRSTSQKCSFEVFGTDEVIDIGMGDVLRMENMAFLKEVHRSFRNGSISTDMTSIWFERGEFDLVSNLKIL